MSGMAGIIQSNYLNPITIKSVSSLNKEKVDYARKSLSPSAAEYKGKVHSILQSKRFSRGILNSKNLGSGYLPTFLEVDGCTCSPVTFQQVGKRKSPPPQGTFFQTSSIFPSDNNTRNKTIVTPQVL